MGIVLNVTYRLYPHNYVKADGNSALYLYLNVNGKEDRLPLNLAWPKHLVTDDSLKPRMKGDPDCHDLNILVRSELSKINDIVKDYRLREQALTLELLTREYQQFALRRDVLAFWEADIKERKKRKKITANTKKSHQSAINHLRAFRDKVTFAEITPGFLRRFEAFLQGRVDSPNTCAKYLRTLRTCLNRAQKQGIPVRPAFDDVQLTDKPTDIVYLTPGEVKALQGVYDITVNDTVREVLRHFLFSCYTGLRVSDLKQIDRTMMEGNRLVFIPVKTENTSGKILRLPMNRPALKLLSQQPETEPPTKLYFPLFTEQYLNRYLKKIAKGEGLDKRVTMHVGRHTFATIFLHRGGKVQVLQQLLGHSSISTTMRYVHIMESEMDEQMELMDDF